SRQPSGGCWDGRGAGRRRGRRGKVHAGSAGGTPVWKGVLEGWSAGVLESCCRKVRTTRLHHSIPPLLPSMRAGMPALPGWGLLPAAAGAGGEDADGDRGEAFAVIAFADDHDALLGGDVFPLARLAAVEELRLVIHLDGDFPLLAAGAAGGDDEALA